MGPEWWVSPSVVHPGDCRVEWELRLTATAQHQEGGLYDIPLVQEKVRIQNSKFGF